MREPTSHPTPHAAQKSELEELVGQNRRTIADRAITARFLSSPDEGQLAALESIWRLGAEMGRLQFFTRNRADLAPAPAPAGYRGR